MATSEFTKKLRAAIKTKIQELGIEVDDELPDYIMIMIANKKDKAKMKNDLMLFLSDNTDPFVDWLFDFFEKVNKKETEEAKAREPEKTAPKKRHTSEERQKSRSRSPVKRSRSRSPRRTRHDEDEKPKRAPIRAPSPRRERERASRRRDERRRRSRSAEDERRSSKRREDRKRITFSDEDDEEPRKTVRSHVVAKADRPASPKVSSQIVVKRRKADPVDAKVGSNIFKRAMTDTLREDEPVRRRRRPNEDVLEVNTSRTTRRTVMKNDDDSDFSAEEPETQFVVKLGKAAATRRKIQASIDEAPPGDDVYAEALRLAKRKKRADDPVLTFLKLAGVRKQKGADIAELEALTRKKLMMAPSGSTGSLANKQWNGKIEFDDDEEDESDDEAEIDAFLATAHDSRIPPTEALSRPLQYAIPQKKQFGVKPAEPGKIHERCRFWPNCRNEKTCIYSHPSKPCGNFPNCWFGDKCLYLHPKCKFDPNCTNPSCIYVHTAPRVIAPRAKPIPRQPNPVAPSIASDSATTGADGEMEKPPVVEQAKVAEQTEITEPSQANETVEQSEASTVAENGDENKTEETPTALAEDEKKEEVVKAEESVPDIPLSTTVKPLKMALHSNVPCRFGPRCHNESCTYRHPKRCRFDEACNKEGCYFWHPKKNAGRFRWQKT